MINPIILNDGVNLHIIPSEKFTTNILCVLMRWPLCREDVTQTAILPALLSRGSEKYPTVRDIRLAAESLQGSVFDAQIIKKGEQQVLQFFLEFVDDGGISLKVLDFLQEIILRPRSDGAGFYAPYVEGESKNLKHRIEGRINNKSEYAKLKCLEALCQGEPFGLYGDGYAEDLPALTPEGLLTHYNSIWATAPVDFIALGKWDESRLKEMLLEKFMHPTDRNLRSVEPSIKIPKPALRQARPERQLIRLDHGTAQGNLCIGLRGDIPPVGLDFIHFQLANEILGGGPNAKLFTHVREKESLCYAIYSTIYRFKSLMCIIAGTEPDKMEHVMELAEQELSALKQGAFTDGELQSAKQSLSKRWRAMQDNPSACVDFYASQYLLEDPHTLDELLSQIAEASSEGVSGAASRLNIDTVVMMQ